MPTRRHFLTRTLPALALTPALAHAQFTIKTYPWIVKLRSASLPVAPGVSVSIRIYHGLAPQHLTPVFGPFTMPSSSAKQIVIPAQDATLNLMGGSSPRLVFVASCTPGSEHMDSMLHHTSITRTIHNPAGDKILFSFRVSTTRLVQKDVASEVVFSPHEPVSA